VNTLELPVAVRRAILAHARRDRPSECCGLLIGRRARVMFAVSMRNTDRDPRRRYRLDARQHIDVRRMLRDVCPRLEIIGAYHSHPDGPALPSETDIAEAFYPDWTHLIVGLGGRTPQIRAFRLAAGTVTPVRLLRGPAVVG
jgi:proteasome lid subunit RPN8/RPN11